MINEIVDSFYSGKISGEDKEYIEFTLAMIKRAHQKGNYSFALSLEESMNRHLKMFYVDIPKKLTNQNK